MKTIGFDLWDGQVKGGSNLRTLMRPAAKPVGSVRDLFLRAYGKFADACRKVDEPGVAIVAVDETSGRAAGIVTLRARVQRPVAAIVGRHDQCDLYLAGNDRLALRQLAVVVSPVASWQRGARVPYRVLDLRTGEGMRDEEGRQLRGLRAEGPSILRCGGYTLFMLALGDPTDWPAAADDAWAALPDRVYFDELEHCAGGSLPRFRMPRPGVAQSVLYRTQGPRDTGMRLVGAGTSGERHSGPAPRSAAAGVLEIRGAHRRVALEIGHEALRDGVLVGRYDRCDGTEATDDPSLSRVHALLVQIDDRLVIVDTASFNGTRICVDADGNGERARVIELDRALELRLGKGTRLTWRWLAS